MKNTIFFGLFLGLYFVSGCVASEPKEQKNKQDLMKKGEKLIEVLQAAKTDIEKDELVRAHSGLINSIFQALKEELDQERAEAQEVQNPRKRKTASGNPEDEQKKEQK